MPLQMCVFSLLNIEKKSNRYGPAVGFMELPWATTVAWSRPAAVRLQQPSSTTAMAHGVKTNRRGLQRLDLQPLWPTAVGGQI
jgi:hypothetical protein